MLHKFLGVPDKVNWSICADPSSLTYDQNYGMRYSMIPLMKEILANVDTKLRILYLSGDNDIASIYCGVSHF